MSCVLSFFLSRFLADIVSQRHEAFLRKFKPWAASLTKQHVLANSLRAPIRNAGADLPPPPFTKAPRQDNESKACKALLCPRKGLSLPDSCVAFD